MMGDKLHMVFDCIYIPAGNAVRKPNSTEHLIANNHNE